MTDLYRGLAPISAAAWAEIDAEAARTLRHFLAGRKLFGISGPHGRAAAALGTGRRSVPDANLAGAETHVRLAQPFIDLRVSFALNRAELESVGRGGADPDLAPVIVAAKELAAAEDTAVFAGFEAGCVLGAAQASPFPRASLGSDYLGFFRVVAQARQVLADAGVGGPYGLAIGTAAWDGLASTTADDGSTLLRDLSAEMDGDVTWAPTLDGVVVVSQRGGDYDLAIGQDASIGYLSHDAVSVTLYLEESLTFRVLTPEAAVVLTA